MAAKIELCCGKGKVDDGSVFYCFIVGSLVDAGLLCLSGKS